MPSPIAYTHDLDFDVIRIILSGSRAGSGIGPYPEIVCVCVWGGRAGGGGKSPYCLHPCTGAFIHAKDDMRGSKRVLRNRGR